MRDLTDKEIERQDFVDNQIFALLNEIDPNQNGIDWDIALIADVRDTICKNFTNRNIATEREFYPYLESNGV